MDNARLKASQAEAVVYVRCLFCGRQYSATIHITELEPTEEE